MKYSFHEEAEKELNDAIDYYNECQNGLGFEFVEEVHSSIQNILIISFCMGSAFS